MQSNINFKHDNFPPIKTQVCNYSDLLPPTEAASARRDRDRFDFGMDSLPFPDDYGFVLIKNTVAGFIDRETTDSASSSSSRSYKKR